MAKCRMVLAFTVILVGICLCSCKIEKISSEKTKDVEYTIVPENEIPQEVKKVIDERKARNLNWPILILNTHIFL